MADDCFVTICHPLHYTVIMNPRFCGLLVLVSQMMSALISLLQNLMILWVSFTVLKIPHFCECNQVVQHACYDTFLNDIVMYSSAGVLGGGPFIGIFYSYSKIVSSIRGVSAQGKYRAFRLCISPFNCCLFFFLPYFMVCFQECILALRISTG